MSERILIVDDEPDIVELVEYNLRQFGYTVVTARDGASAFAEVRRQQPDLILLDLMLPDVSGTEICRRLKTTTSPSRSARASWCSAARRCSGAASPATRPATSGW